MIDSKQAYVVFEKHPTTLFEMDVNAQDDTVKLICKRWLYGVVFN